MPELKVNPHVVDVVATSMTRHVITPFIDQSSKPPESCDYGKLLTQCCLPASLPLGSRDQLASLAEYFYAEPAPLYAAIDRAMKKGAVTKTVDAWGKTIATALTKKTGFEVLFERVGNESSFFVCAPKTAWEK
jgi:hypothetical protein